MSDEAERIARYRAHAISLRMIAKDAPDTKTRLALVTIADDFDRMADSAEGPE